ncbi:MAG: hypothetical protein ACP5D2_02360 [Candidatus Nanoarchaeia archaeon]
MKKDMEESKRVRFSDLSWPLKTAVIAAWVYLIYFVGLFGLGFMVGLLGL